MQRVQITAHRWLLASVDALVLVLSFLLVAQARESFGAWWNFDLLPGDRIFQVVTTQSQLPLLLLVAPLWVIALWINGLYGDLRRLRRDVLALRTLWAVTQALFALLGVLFLLQPAVDPSRTFLLSFALTSAGGLFLARNRLRNSSLLNPSQYNILVIGSAAEVLPFLDVLRRHNDWGMKIVGVLRPDHETLSPVGGVEVLGTVSDLQRVLQQRNVAQVFMTGRAWDNQTLHFVADTCEEIGVTFSMDANFLGLSISQADVQDYEGWGVLTFSSVPTQAEALVLKRVIDIVGSATALAILSPFFLLTALAIKIEDGGPIFFGQERCGLYGRRFKMYKFRSMVVDAEKKLAELTAKNEMSGPVFKMTHDPRITRVGRWIRKLSIDEFPQFWNVLIGEMSLVGPRPPIPSEVARYERWQMRRLSMRPGITCIWQVSGRNNIDFDTWMKLDLQYIDNWSLILDLKLLLKTVPVVVFGVGAR